MMDCRFGASRALVWCMLPLVYFTSGHYKLESLSIRIGALCCFLDPRMTGLTLNTR